MKFRIVLPLLLLLASVMTYASENRVVSVYKKAVRQFAAGEFNSAKKNFQKTLRTASKTRDFHIRAKSCSYMGDIYFYGGDGETALDYYRRAMNDKKVRSGVRYRIGRTLVSMKKYGEGMSELREFLVHKSAKEGLEDHALYWIARAYQGMGQKENALKTLDVLVSLDPDTLLRDTVIKYRADLKKWDQKEEYQKDLKKIFNKEESDPGIEKGLPEPEEITGPEEITNTAGVEEIPSSPLPEEENSGESSSSGAEK